MCTRDLLERNGLHVPLVHKCIDLTEVLIVIFDLSNSNHFPHCPLSAKHLAVDHHLL